MLSAYTSIHSLMMPEDIRGSDRLLVFEFEKTIIRILRFGWFQMTTAPIIVIDRRGWDAFRRAVGSDPTSKATPLKPLRYSWAAIGIERQPTAIRMTAKCAICSVSRERNILKGIGILAHSRSLAAIYGQYKPVSRKFNFGTKTAILYLYDTAKDDKSKT